MSVIRERLASLPDDVRRVLREFVADLTRALGQELEAVLLYGSAARGGYVAGRSNLNVLCVVRRQALATMQACAALHRKWGKERIVVPLLLTEDELRGWASHFPLEWTDMRHRAVVLAGRDPLADTQVSSDLLLRACEQELRGNLLRLRQRFMEGGGSSEAMAMLIPLSATSVLACLRGLAQVANVSWAGSTEQLLTSLSTDLGLDLEAVHEAWNLKRGLIGPGPLEVPRLFERYLSALEAAAAGIGRLKAEGRLS
jgi:predicted nucleotidyltransferase